MGIKAATLDSSSCFELEQRLDAEFGETLATAESREFDQEDDRFDAGRESLDIRRMNLGDTVRQIAIKWQHAMASRQMRFTSNVPVRDVYVVGDTTALSRLLNILLDNAVKYTPSPGTIELILEARNESAVITVRDSGIGISDEDRLEDERAAGAFRLPQTK